MVIITKYLEYLMPRSREEFFKRNNAFSLYDFYMSMPDHKGLCPGRHKIYNFDRPFLCYHYQTLNLSDLSKE